MRKVMDLVCVVDSYTDKQGQQKKKYQNVGALMEGDKGQFIMLDRFFNPAGLPNPDNRSNCIICGRNQPYTSSNHLAMNSGDYKLRAFLNCKN